MCPSECSYNTGTERRDQLSENSGKSVVPCGLGKGNYSPIKQMCAYHFSETQTYASRWTKKAPGQTLVRGAAEVYLLCDDNSSAHVSLIYGGEHFPFDQRRFGLEKVGEWLAPQWPPKMPPHSMPKTSEYIHFYGKRDFAGVIMLKVLSWGSLDWALDQV